MIVRSLDVNGDWNFGRGRNDYLSGIAAVGQKIVTRVKSFLGDCFFDQGAGIDWFHLLGSKNFPLLDFNLRVTIINSPLVSSLVVPGSNLDPVTRIFSPSYQVFSSISATPINTSQLFVNGLLTELGDILTTESGEGIGV